MTDLELHPRNPLRPLDWRWRRAHYLASAGLKPHRRRDDLWIKAAARLIRPPGTKRGRRPTGAAVIEAAIRLRSDPDPLPRREAEARLLAGQDPAVIDDRLGLVPGAAVGYQSLFYAVSDRLTHIDSIATLAIGPAAFGLDGAIPIDVAARQIAYNFGPLAIDALVRFLGWPGAARTPALSPAVEARLARAFGTLLGAMTLPASGADALPAFRLSRRVAELERRAAARSGASLLRPVALAPATLVAILSGGEIAAAPPVVEPVPSADADSERDASAA